ncbi:hypothetical protein MMPV_005263 [Pyropia vietnamensis]
MRPPAPSAAPPRKALGLVRRPPPLRSRLGRCPLCAIVFPAGRLLATHAAACRGVGASDRGGTRRDGIGRGGRSGGSAGAVRAGGGGDDAVDGPVVVVDEPTVGGTALPAGERRAHGGDAVAKRRRVALPRDGLEGVAPGGGAAAVTATHRGRGGHSGGWPPADTGRPPSIGGQARAHPTAMGTRVAVAASGVDGSNAAGGVAVVGAATESNKRGGFPPGNILPPTSLRDEAPRPRVRRQPVVPPSPDDGLGTNTAVPGMQVFPGALTTAAAAALLTAAAADDATVPWVNVKTRWMKQYGPRFFRPHLFGGPDSGGGGGGGGRRPTPLPPYVASIVLPLLQERVPALANWSPNQLCLNRYEAGTGHAITPHNDNEDGSLRVAVAGVCVGAAAVMTFLHADGAKRDVALPGGCVYVMSGDAFAVWRHAIFARNIDYRRGGGARVSLTLRQVEEQQAVGGGGKRGQPRAASLTRAGTQRAAWPRVCGPMDAFTRPPSPGKSAP